MQIIGKSGVSMVYWAHSFAARADGSDICEDTGGTFHGRDQHQQHWI